jgi:hypothetical protein
MIASNFRKHPDAMALQLVLSFGKPVWNTKRPTSRMGRVLRSAQAALVKATPQLVNWTAVPASGWFVAFKRRAKALARSVKRNLMTIF